MSARLIVVERGQLATRLFLLWALAAGLLVVPRDLAYADESTAEQSPATGSKASVLAKAYVDQRAKQFALEAEIAFLDKEVIARSGLPRNGNVAAVLRVIDPEARDLLAEILQNEAVPVEERLTSAIGRVDRFGWDLKNEWIAVRSAIREKQICLADLQAEKHVAGQLASLLNVNNRWFWMFGLIAFISLAGVVIHDRRHEIRRMLNGGKARAMGLSKVLFVALLLMTAVTMMTFFFGDRIYRAIVMQTFGDASSQDDEIPPDDELEPKRTAAQKRHEAALEGWERQIQGRLGSNSELFAQQERAGAKARELAVALALHRGMATELEADLKRLTEIEEEITVHSEQLARYNTLRKRFRAGLGLALISLAVTGGMFFQRGIHRRHAIVRSTCPLCLGENTFNTVGDVVVCTNEDWGEEDEECGFEYLSIYREMVKVCFPLLGAPSAGKTHWATEVFAQLNHTAHEEKVQFNLLNTPKADEFKAIVRRIHQDRMPPEPTGPGIPSPLTFRFVDCDKWRRSDVLLNIFDYAGEITTTHRFESRHRRRALDGDGFLFFVDPTRRSDDQASALHQFREDITRIKGLKAGKDLRSPVALCVPKIDLMISQKYGGGIIENFYADLAAVGWESNPESIETRSQLTRELRDTVWPRWNIEGEISNLFGGRCMYFPLTPVGLEECGEEDLKKRTLAPVGLLEPLLWLLHMNGYPVWA